MASWVQFQLSQTAVLTSLRARVYSMRRLLSSRVAYPNTHRHRKDSVSCQESFLLYSLMGVVDNAKMKLAKLANEPSADVMKANCRQEKLKFAQAMLKPTQNHLVR